VIDVALVSVIRRWCLRDKLSIREVARRTGLSKNTVKKYLRDENLEPSYPKRKGPSKLDEFTATLVSWLKLEFRRHRKQRRSLRQIYLDLRAHGYDGSYDRVAAFAREWRRNQPIEQGGTQRGVFIPLRFAPGEAFQFDWSEDYAFIGKDKVKLQIAHFKLSYSRAFFLRAYLLQTHEMLFDAHAHAFRVFGGVPQKGIYDNMKTAVDKIGRGKNRTVNARFQAMAGHYLFEPEFCNAASGWEKGQVEKNVQDSRRRIWQYAPRVQSLDELNVWLESYCIGLWDVIQHPEMSGAISTFLSEERGILMENPTPFDGFVEVTKRVTPTCLVCYDRNRYSVPAAFANRPVSVRVYCDKIVAVAEGQKIAEHQRVIQRCRDKPGKTVYDWRHYLTVLQRKPGALRNGAPFQDLPEGFRVLQEYLMKQPGGDREMAEILALVLHHDEDAVLSAVELALESGAASKVHVLNILGRLIEEPAPGPVETPTGLALSVEPEPNVSRYDELRGGRDAA
jgi:transposase